MGKINGINKIRKTVCDTKKLSFGKFIVLWGMKYVSITTAGFFILILMEKPIPGEMIALTGTVATVIVASYAYKAKAENVAKIESIIPQEEMDKMCIDEG